MIAILACCLVGNALDGTPASDPAIPRIGKNLVQNPSFEIWSGSEAPGWAAGQGHGSEWRALPLTASTDASADNTSCELPCMRGQDLAVIAQDIPAAGIRLDNTMAVSADVKSEVAYSVQVKLSFKRKSGTAVQERYNRGGAAWEKVFWKFEVPPDADPATFRLEIIRFPERGDAPSLVDNVVMEFEAPPVPAEK